MKVAYILDEKEKQGIKLFSIKANASLKDVAVELTKNNIGALLVLSDDEKPTPIGIISERDIIKYCSEDKPLDQIKLKDFKLNDMIVITENDTLETARSIMSRHHIRHLPVLSKESIIGMITIRDVIKVLDEQKDIKINHLSDFMGGTYGNAVY